MSLQGFRTVLDKRLRADAGIDAGAGAKRDRALGNLQIGQRQFFGGQPGAAILFRDRPAEIAALAHLLHDFFGDAVFGLDAVFVRDRDVANERADLRQEQLEGFGLANHDVSLVRRGFSALVCGSWARAPDCSRPHMTLISPASFAILGPNSSSSWLLRTRKAGMPQLIAK